ncbi:uncharacterized protein LOC113793288 [Dermatophagoides pteronyssinus]|uniref:Uncharacterized protein LOC113793288 n=1 Tax=Dermatophagoides pteronyssinus TaxID=6956 RepID=A0A6P6Y0M5_DERPT|nr:uncharacterized protein LOC113793288 [Dermatophagoides pteronyssinus]
MRWPYLIWIFLCPVNAITFFQSNCSGISSNPSANILLIGMRRNHLTIIDRRFFVFEIERSLFTNNGFRIPFGYMYLKMPFEKRWPEAFSNSSDKKRFEKLQPYVRFGFIWSEYNLTFAYENENKISFFSYDLNYDRWYWNVTVVKPLTKMSKEIVFISNLSPNRDKLGLIRFRKKDGQILMTRYGHLEQSYFLCSVDLIDDGRRIENVTLGNNPCAVEKRTPIALDGEPIIKAFETQTYFFFLTKKYIYHVSSIIMRNTSLELGLSFQMKREKIEEIFLCEASIVQWTMDNSLIVVMIAILIFAGIAAIIYDNYLSSIHEQSIRRSVIIK